jgi:hypothetical protein
MVANVGPMALAVAQLQPHARHGRHGRERQGRRHEGLLVHHGQLLLLFHALPVFAQARQALAGVGHALVQARDVTLQGNLPVARGAHVLDLALHQALEALHAGEVPQHGLEATCDRQEPGAADAVERAALPNDALLEVLARRAERVELRRQPCATRLFRAHQQLLRGDRLVDLHQRPRRRAQRRRREAGLRRDRGRQREAAQEQESQTSLHDHTAR